MAKFVVLSERVEAALVKSQIISPDEINYVRRVIIDMEIGRPAMVYVEKFADDERIDLLLRTGLELVEKEPDDRS